MHKDLITFYGDEVSQPIKKKRKTRCKLLFAYKIKLSLVKYKPPHRIESRKLVYIVKTSTGIALITKHILLMRKMKGKRWIIINDTDIKRKSGNRLKMKKERNGDCDETRKKLKESQRKYAFVFLYL